MSHDLSNVDTMAVRSAFMRLITTRPDPNAMAQALAKGPFIIYQTFASTIYVPTDGGDALTLIGRWGFGSALDRYATVPLTVDFPLVRSFLTGQLLVKQAQTEMSNVLATTALAAVLGEQGRNSDGVSVIAMPLQYGGVSIGGCVSFCTHRGDWTWNDHAYIDGTAALVSMWLQLRNLESQQQTLSGRRAPRTQMLTERQREVLRLVSEGKSNAAIAASLGYSVSTVKNDIASLLTFLGASRRKELVRKAEAAGLLTAGSDATR